MDRRSLAVILACALAVPGLPAIAGASLDAGPSPSRLTERIGDTDPMPRPGQASTGDVLEPGLLDEIETRHGLIVHFDDVVPQPVLDGSIPGIDVRYRFEAIPSVYAVGTAASVDALRGLEQIRYVEDAWKPITYHLDSATIASRAREVWDPGFEPVDAIIDEPSPNLTAMAGEPIDGDGVGIAVVDTGVDATHPALAAPGKTQANYLVTPEGVVQGDRYTELASAHGTHMAGIAAGTGAAAPGDREMRGAAPGASLYTFADRILPPLADQRTATVIAPAIAMDWILQHGADQAPPIQVVLNAWSCQDGACEELNPEQAHIRLASDLAHAGFTVVFPVGNAGGEGLINQVTAEARIPTQGVLGVANHDDEEKGARSDCIKSSSSRGLASDPSTWPDIAAPGDEVSSPNAIHPGPDTRVPIGGAGDPTSARKAYTAVTGTSAAAAHVAGVVALLLDANPSLSPPAIEHILETTAFELPTLTKHGGTCPIPYLRADPSNPFSEANFAAGHGLIDAQEAVEQALAFSELPDPGEAPELEPIPDTFISAEPAVTGITRTFYASGQNDLSTELPGLGAPEMHAGRAGDTFSFTSPPLEAGFSTDGVLVDFWAGSTLEFLARFVSPEFHVQVERLPADGGAPELVAEEQTNTLQTLPVQPQARHAVITTIEAEVEDEMSMVPTTFEEDDRVRLNLTLVGSTGGSTGPVSNPVLRNWIVYADARPVPTRLQFGSTDRGLEPFSDAWCMGEDTCARLGGALERNNMDCAFPRTYHVRWTGPPGSSATVACDGAVASCQVPADLQAPEGICIAETTTGSSGVGHIGQCTYQLPDGSTGGEGYCAGFPAAS